MWRTPSCGWDIAGWGIFRLWLAWVLVLRYTRRCVERENDCKDPEIIIAVPHPDELRLSVGWRWRARHCFEGQLSWALYRSGSGSQLREYESKLLNLT